MRAQETSTEVLKNKLEEYKKKYGQYKAMGLDLNVSRGVPCTEQLDLNNEMFALPQPGDCISEEGFDIRTYGVTYGLVECRRLFADLLGLPIDNIVIGGNSSLNLMYDELCRIWCFGTLGEEPWHCQQGLKFLCPAPGYDCHFAITEAFGFEMITIPMHEDGPDMDMIENLVAEDPSIKGIWCVPLFTNPQGICYSDEVVTRFAKMKTAAKDFRIFWDNAYPVHYVYKEHTLKNIYVEAEKYGTTDRILYFASTAKITFPGSAVCMVASGDRTIAELKGRLPQQIISHDKINQLRHVQYLKDPENIKKHMWEVAAILRPRFDLTDSLLRENMEFEDLLTWKVPDGGYFITADTYPGCAKKALTLASEAGVMIAAPGATYPYHKDPNDSNVRLAPTKPAIEDMKTAFPLFCVCAQIAGIEKILSDRGETA